MLHSISGNAAESARLSSSAPSQWSRPGGRLLAESQNAFIGLYRAHAQELHGFVRRRLGRQEAEDIVQDAYLHLLQKEKFETLDHPRAFLFRIASNLAVDALRKNRTRCRHAENELALCDAADSKSAEAAAAEVIEMRRFQAALNELPPVCRQAFILNRIDGFTHAEIAAQLSVSIRTIDRHMVKAQNHLQRRFRGHNRA